MNQQQQEQIVIECQRLSLILKGACQSWLHVSTEKRFHPAYILASAADDMYKLLHNNPEIMGSDTCKPAFDTPDHAEFQENMQSLWDQEEPDFRRMQE